MVKKFLHLLTILVVELHWSDKPRSLHVLYYIHYTCWRFAFAHQLRYRFSRVCFIN
jgi:hypothetical protein